MQGEKDNLNDFPGIERTGKTSPFRVPERYFEQLPNAISERIHEPVPESQLNWIPRLAVSFAIVAVLAFLINRYAPEQETQVTLSDFDITSEHLTETGYLSEMDESLLLESLEIEDMDLITDTIEAADMQNFLMENRTDINLIINEL